MPCPDSVLLTVISHRTGWPDLGLSLQLLLGHLCHLTPCLPQLVPAMCLMEVVLLSHLWWKSPIFPGNIESQGGQICELEIHLSTTNRFLHRCVDNSYLGKRYSPAFSNHQSGNLRDGHDPPQLHTLKPDLWDPATSF